MAKIYYFTRTGDSKKVAESIAAQNGVELCPITDGQDWSGAGGYLRGGYYASAKKSLPASYKTPEPGEEIYLCFPIWAGSFPPAVRSFVDAVGRTRIIAVPSSKGSHLKDTEGFARVLEVIGPHKAVTL